MPDTPKPAPPTNVTIRLLVDNDPNFNIKLRPESIEVLNNFWHAQGLNGTFAERFEQMMVDTAKALMMREDLAPASVLTKINDLKAAQVALDDKIAQVAAKAAGA
jgi:hypothetical protein